MALLGTLGRCLGYGFFLLGGIDCLLGNSFGLLLTLLGTLGRCLGSGFFLANEMSGVTQI